MLVVFLPFDLPSCVIIFWCYVLCCLIVRQIVSLVQIVVNLIVLAFTWCSTNVCMLGDECVLVWFCFVQCLCHQVEGVMFTFTVSDVFEENGDM